MAPRTSSLALLLVLVTALLCLATTASAQGGKCVKFHDFEARAQGPDLLNFGVQRSICGPLLAESYDEYWVSNETLSQLTNTDEDCLADTQHILEGPVRAFVNTFGPDQPTSLCQKLMTMQLCLYYFPRCDSRRDMYGTHDSAGWTENKPCRWFCETFKDGAADAVCTPEDHVYMNSVGLPLANATLMPEFNCASSRYTDANDCLVLSNVMEHRPAHRCELYSGGLLPEGLNKANIPR